MAKEYENFRRTYFDTRRPLIGDPMTGTDVRAAAGQGQPNPTPMPHNIPHSQPPSGQPPTATPSHGPVTPNTRPAPPIPGPGRP